PRSVWSCHPHVTPVTSNIRRSAKQYRFVQGRMRGLHLPQAASCRRRMFSRLADRIDRHPWRFLLAALAIVAVACALGIRVHDHRKPRGFEVPGSGSEKARALIMRASGADPGNSVLALVRLPAPYGTTGARRALGGVEARLRRDPAVVAVVDAASA